MSISRILWCLLIVAIGVQLSGCSPIPDVPGPIGIPGL